MVFFSLVAALVKLTCRRDLSLLVTLVILSNLFETASLLKLSVSSLSLRSNNGLNQVEKGFLNYSPLGAISAVLLLNFYVVTAHFRSLKSGQT